jgi:hypothetical protein
VEKGSYLLELARYVVLNLLRAGMVKEIGDWPWSSYPTMIGVVPAPVWLQTDWLFGQFDPQRKQALEKYEDFVRAGIGLPRVVCAAKFSLAARHLSRVCRPEFPPNSRWMKSRACSVGCLPSRWLVIGQNMGTTRAWGWRWPI